MAVGCLWQQSPGSQNWSPPPPSSPKFYPKHVPSRTLLKIHKNVFNFYIASESKCHYIIQKWVFIALSAIWRGHFLFSTEIYEFSEAARGWQPEIWPARRRRRQAGQSSGVASLEQPQKTHKSRLENKKRPSQISRKGNRCLCCIFGSPT